MSSKISSCRHELQNYFVKNRARSRRKCHGGITANQNSTYRRLRRSILCCNGVCDWEVARLAALCGISERQFNRDLNVLVGRGLIVKIERRQSRLRSLTNLYMLPALVPLGVGDKNVGQKQELLETKTTTPARENPRVTVEARCAENREAHHRMRERYETVGRELVEAKAAAREENRRWWREGERHRWDGGKDHRLARAEERTRMASQAAVGVYTGPKLPDPTAEEIAAFWKRDAEHRAKIERRMEA